MSRAKEGRAEIEVMVARGYEPRAVLEEIRTRVDAVRTFPAEAERPIYRLSRSWFEVIGVVVAGPLEALELRRLGERVRDDLLALSGITRVVLEGARPYEISVEVPEPTLQRYGLTFAGIADAIREGSLDLTAGTLRTRGGEILLRTTTQAYDARDLASIVVRAGADGALLVLGDVARIRDGLDEDRMETRWDGEPAMVVTVHLAGRQSAIEIAAKVRDYVEDAGRWLPAGTSVAVWRDQSRIICSHLNTLLAAAWQGGLLIFVLLTLFLRFRVALWVFLGIPVSFAGALMLMPVFGLTINALTLLAFILVLGLVVDDAIVTGESIHRRLEHDDKGDPEGAVIRGTRDIAMPVTFGVLTTVAAFAPMLFVEGERGTLFLQVPAVVIPVLLFSLVESKLILPAHLKRVRPHDGAGRPARWRRIFPAGLDAATHRVYQPLLGSALRHRYLAAALFTGGAAIVLACVASGRIPFVFFPKIQSEIAPRDADHAARDAVRDHPRAHREDRPGGGAAAREVRGPRRAVRGGRRRRSAASSRRPAARSARTAPRAASGR